MAPSVGTGEESSVLRPWGRACVRGPPPHTSTEPEVLGVGGETAKVQLALLTAPQLGEMVTTQCGKHGISGSLQRGLFLLLETRWHLGLERGKVDHLP